MKLDISITALVVGFALVANGLATEILTNGNFEAGNTAFASGYGFTLFNIADGQYGVVTNGQAFNPNFAPFGDHTSGTGEMLVVNGSTVANVKFYSTAFLTAANTQYEFSGWIAAASDPTLTSPPTILVSVNGTAAGSFSLPLNSQTGFWYPFFLDFSSTSHTLSSITLVDSATDYSGNDFALDDLLVVKSPEPSSIILAAIGALALLAYRRRSTLSSNA